MMIPESDLIQASKLQAVPNQVFIKDNVTQIAPLAKMPKT